MDVHEPAWSASLSVAITSRGARICFVKVMERMANRKITTHCVRLWGRGVLLANLELLINLTMHLK